MLNFDADGLRVVATDGEAWTYANQLVDTGVAKVDGDIAVVPWATVFSLLSDASHDSSTGLLDLPESTDYVPELGSRGGLSDSSFAIFISRWRTKDGTPLSPVWNIAGAILSDGKNRFLVSEAVWRLASAVSELARLPVELRTSNENRHRWGAIRRLMLDAEAYRSAFLDQTVVLTPKDLSLSLSRQNVAGESVIVVEPGFDDAPEGWLSSFDRWTSVQDRYDLPQPGGRLVQIVIDPKVKSVLQEIKRMPGRRVAGQRAEAFIRNPFGLLGGDAEEVISEGEVERARAEARIGTTTAIYNELRNDEHLVGLRATLTTTYGPGDFEETIVEIGNSDDLRRLIAEIDQKTSQQRLAYQWKGNEIEVTADTSHQLDRLRTWLDEWQRGTQEVTYAEIFDLSKYSARIAGFGVEEPYVSPYIARKSDGLPWIPNNVDVGISWGGEGDVPRNHLPLTTDDIASLQTRIALAKARGDESVSVPGCTTPLKIHDAENIVRGLSSAVAETAAGTVAETLKRSPKPEHRKSLVLKANIDTLDYEEKRSSLQFVRGSTPVLPQALKPSVRLKAHQREGLAWLQHIWSKSPANARGCLLADDMGLGKTLQLLAFLASCFEAEPGLPPALVVAPVSLLRNWSQEIDKFLSPGTLKVLPLYSGTAAEYRTAGGGVDGQLAGVGITSLLRPGWRGDANLVLTTYESLRDLEFSLARERWSILVCDEAQRIKNPGAMVTRAAKKMDARFKIACTGTPVENSLADLWCLFDFFQPGLLGPLNEFGRKYRKPIECETEEQQAALNELQTLIDPQILRRLKRDVVSDLPAKSSDAGCLQLKMAANQRQLYLSAIAEMKAKARVAPAAPKRGIDFGMLHRMRSLCAHPLPGNRDLGLREAAEHSPKLRWLIESLKSIQAKGEKALVFTEFLDLQRALQRYVSEALGVRVPIINGDTNTGFDQSSSRQGIIDRFQGIDGFGVMILSPLAVGFGVNIQAANHVIHFTRTWNPAKEDQATDRAYRIGQDKPVTVYTPTVTADFITFEQKLHSLLEYKRNLSSNMLDGVSQVSSVEMMNLIEDAPVEEAGALSPVSTDSEGNITGDGMKGLIIDETPITKILAGRKTWEMRSTSTSVRGTIALIKKGSGQVVGLADLVDSVGPLSPEDVRANEHRHQIEPSRQLDPKIAKYRFAWVLDNVRALPKPVPYSHPSGAVIWVNLDAGVSSFLEV